MSDEKRAWLEELANAQVGGNYVPSAEGLIVVFSLVDAYEEPIEVKKTFDGKAAGTKKQWKVIVHELKFHKNAYREVLEDKKPKKIEYIDDFVLESETTLELSRTASKALAQFMLDEKIDSGDKIKYLRLGDSFDTEYKFKKNE